MRPAFDSNGFKNYQADLKSPRFDHLISTVKKLNAAISEDVSLGERFAIGHSFFSNLDCNKIENGTLSDIINYEIIPLFKEYWFDDEDKVQIWIKELVTAVK